MKLFLPPWNLSQLNNKLIRTVFYINRAALKITSDVRKTYNHLRDIYNIYQYVYYVALVDHILKKSRGKIIDFGGFAGQVTILLQSLGYNCDNYATYYPSQKKLFDKFNINYKINKDNPKILPYKNNSCLSVISSGVLEHVYEEGMSEEEALNEFYRILKPGGYFFCWNLPRKWSLIEVISTFKKTSCHPIKYRIKDVKYLSQKCGFQIIYLDQHGDVCIHFLRTILRKLFHPWHAFVIDYYLSKLPLINLFSHHITFVLRKPK